MLSRWQCLATIVIVVAGALVIGGCGGGRGGAGDGSGPQGLLRVALTDQTGYANVTVAIREVRAVPQGDEDAADAAVPVVETFEPPMVVNVTDLSYEQILLGESLVPAGEYCQVRLVLAPNPSGQDPVNYVTLSEDPTTRIPLRTPSAQQSGLKIVGSFTVGTGTESSIVLDFDPSRAIVHNGNGNYLLKPTGIRLTQTASLEPQFGALAGTVSPAGAWPVAQIEATPVGGLQPVATATADLTDGSFRLPLPAGSYTLRITAAGYQTLDTGTLEPPTVFVVTEAADTPAGELLLTASL